MIRQWMVALPTLVIGFLLAGCVSNQNDVVDSNETPDINGVWQVLGSAHWNLEGQNAFKGPATNVLGALGGVPAGVSYVVGGLIPYKEEAGPFKISTDLSVLRST